jgi:hypothetical protein
MPVEGIEKVGVNVGVIHPMGVLVGVKVGGSVSDLVGIGEALGLAEGT